MNISKPAVSDAEMLEIFHREIPAALAFLEGPDFIFQSANEEYLKIVGRSDILGKPLLEALPEMAGQRFPEILRGVWRTGKNFVEKEVRVYFQRSPAKLDEVFVDLTYRRVNDKLGKASGILVFAIDVTEKVRARNSVQLEQRKLASVFMSSKVSLAILRGPDGIYENTNASYRSLFNDRPLDGLPLLEALPELRGQKFPELARHVFESGETYTEVEAVAYLRRTADSPLQKRYFDQSYIRIEDANGAPYGVVIEAADVTERVESRQKLADSDRRFRVAIEAARMGTWAIETSTGAVDASERTLELFGFKPGETVRMEAMIDRIHPEDQKAVREEIARALDPTGSGLFSADYRLIDLAGARRWLSVRGQAAFADGGEASPVVSFSGTVLDVTESFLAEEALRRSEKQFRTMADVMPQVVWTADAGGTLDYTNERWTQYSGSDEPARWLDFVHPADLERTTASWIDSVKSGEEYETEFRLLRKNDQSYRWFLVRAQASLDPEGRVIRWFGTCTDIEDQKAALAARSEFMSIASHELKTPLTSLKLQTQSMRRNFELKRANAFSFERVGELVGNNERQINRLVRLVDDMLDFAKIDAGKLSMVLEETDVGATVAEVFTRLREQLEAAGCEASLERGPTDLIMADKFRLEQVVTNLLTNALRYGRGRPVRVEVSQSATEIFIAVKDEGHGIAPIDQERIFNRFERAVSANEVSGLGLGLFITKQIVDAHGGSATVKSIPGQGATFLITLPKEKK